MFRKDIFGHDDNPNAEKTSHFSKNHEFIKDNNKTVKYINLIARKNEDQ